MDRHDTENRQPDQDDATRQQRSATFTAFGLAAEAKPLPAGLYVVATPIGNLQDVSFRALSVLAAADAVLAEDTRVTKTLLAHYGITTPLVAYHEHSNDAVRERMIHADHATARRWLWCPTPARLWCPIQATSWCRRRSTRRLPVTPIPGPSAVLTALVASGLPTDRFFFEGFLPRKERRPPDAARPRSLRPRHAHAVRRPAPPARHAGRRGGGARRSTGGRGARAHQDVRDDPARHACRNWRPSSPRKALPKARSWC